MSVMAFVIDALPTIVLADAGDGDSPGWLLAAGPAGGVALYWMIYRFYRNTDKRHRFERETLIEAKPVTGDDQKVDEVKGTRESRIQGDNVANYRQRVQRIT
jgi:hypothetical protein